MTFSEFEYWLDGLKEGMHGKPPTKTQWEKIQKKLKEVAPGPYPYYQLPYYTTPYYTTPYYTTPYYTTPYYTTPSVTWWNGSWCQTDTDTWNHTSIPCSGSTTALSFNNSTSTVTIPYALSEDSLRC